MRFNAPYKLILALALVGALIAVAPSQASATQTCEIVTQYHAPITVRQGPCVNTDATSFWVSGYGEVLSGPSVVACTLYVKVWRNHTLVGNSARNCDAGFFARYISPGRSAPRGTRITAQSWFDVRYRVGGTYVTERFQSPRAVDTVG